MWRFLCKTRRAWPKSLYSLLSTSIIELLFTFGTCLEYQAFIHMLRQEDLIAPSLEQGKLVLPHPSPRNNRWLKQNPWFEAEVLPELKSRIKGLLQSPSS